MTNGTKLNATARQGDSLLRHLAVCIPTGGMYKCLTEIDMSKITSDAELFRALKSVYHGSRKSKAKWRMFLKPVSVEFVQVCGNSIPNESCQIKLEGYVD